MTFGSGQLQAGPDLRLAGIQAPWAQVVLADFNGRNWRRPQTSRPSSATALSWPKAFNMIARGSHLVNVHRLHDD